MINISCFEERCDLGISEFPVESSRSGSDACCRRTQHLLDGTGGGQPCILGAAIWAILLQGRAQGQFYVRLVGWRRSRGCQRLRENCGG